MKMSAEHNVEMLVVAKLNMNFYNLKPKATLYDWQRTEPKLHYLTKLHIQNAIHICTNLIGVWLTNIKIILNKVDYQNTFLTHTFG